MADDVKNEQHKAAPAKSGDDHHEELTPKPEHVLEQDTAPKPPVVPAPSPPPKPPASTQSTASTPAPKPSPPPRIKQPRALARATRRRRSWGPFAFLLAEDR